MYPWLRLGWHMVKALRAPRLGTFDSHAIHTRIWPQDIDPWRELNNGRTLTLYDLGRISMFLRSELSAVMRREGWGGTVAGVSVRFRRRVTLWQRVEIRSRLVGWDHRFVYLTQSMWAGDTPASQVLVRIAIVEGGRMVPTERVGAALRAAGIDLPETRLPGWVRAWIAAENRRIWPPEE